MVGKWHLCPTVEMNLASTRRNWPADRGFERWYGFLGAETTSGVPDLVYDNHPVDPPEARDQGYHLTEDLTDKAPRVHHGREGRRARTNPSSCTTHRGRPTLHIRSQKEWADRFKGRFDQGYEQMRVGDPGAPEDDGPRSRRRPS